MLKVAILDDYQNVAQEFVDLNKLSGKFEIGVFNEPFESEEDAQTYLFEKHGIGLEEIFNESPTIH